jgi:hypothetical protein
MNEEYIPSEISIKLVEKEALIAIVTLKFGILVVRGFRVMTSKVSDEFWVIPPSYRAGKWHPIFYLEDKEKWQRIQQMILAKLDEQLAEQKPDDIDASIESIFGK